MLGAEDERTLLEGSGPWLQVGLTPLSGDPDLYASFSELRPTELRPIEVRPPPR